MPCLRDIGRYCSRGVKLSLLSGWRIEPVQPVLRF